MEWRFFDPDADFTITARDRPHWDQSGAMTFVSFRLADSMPKEVVQRWLNEIKDWFAEKGVTKSNIERVGSMPQLRAVLKRNCPVHLHRALLKLANQGWHEGLDYCHGRCLLRRPAFARLVAESLLSFEGTRYDIDRFVVMPNHVHLLVQMKGPWELRKQCESWLRFTGRKMNAEADSTGAVWAEPFDHIVRSPEQFEYLQRYIFENPVKARLANEEFLIWIRETGEVKATAFRDA